MTLSAKTRMLSSVARIGGYHLADRVTRPRPVDVNTIPSSDKAITREWLSGALCGQYPGAEVVGFTLEGGDHGTTSRRSITVVYNDAGTAAGLPARVFLKSTAKFTSRVMVGLSGATINEAGFHNHIRPELAIEAPAALYAAAHAGSGRSVFLFEDMAVRRGCTFIDPSYHLTRANAEDMVGLLATFHAAYWDSPRLDRDFTWLRSSLEFQSLMNDMISFESRSLVGIDRAQQVIPAELLRRKKGIFPATMRSLEINVRGPQTCLHHDVHIGNWYVTGEGRMGLSDWQCTVKGNWACDLAYALSCGLETDNRRAWEQDLLRLYLDRLARSGVVAPSFDEAWLAYRQQMFHGLIFWVYTIGQGALQPKMQPDAVSLINIGRMANAVADLDSFDALTDPERPALGRSSA
jgi:Phosphotransferase enzyme family